MHPLLDLSARPIIGHRGNCAHAPENTLESFRQAIALGVDALEFDVRLTADGEVVVFHDPTVDRMTDGTGEIARLTMASLRRLDAGAKFTRDGGLSHPYRGSGIGISTLEDVLDATAPVPLLIEVKVPDAAPHVRRIIERRGDTERVIVGAFNARTLAPFAGSAIAISASERDTARMLLPSLLGRRYRSLPFRVLSIPPRARGIRLPLAALVKAAKPAGVPVHVWTINHREQARRLWEIGVCGILSDNPGALIDWEAGGG